MKKKTSLEANSCWNFFDVSIRLCRLRVKWWRKNDYDYITQDQYAERHGRRQRRHPLKRLGSPTVKHGRIPSIKYYSTRPWWVFFLCRSSPSFVVRSPSDGKKSVDRFSDWKIWRRKDQHGRKTWSFYIYGFRRFRPLWPILQRDDRYLAGSTKQVRSSKTGKLWPLTIIFVRPTNALLRTPESENWSLQLPLTTVYSYDPKIGRFYQIDPNNEQFFSPYVYAGNSALSLVDLGGQFHTIQLFSEDPSIQRRNFAKFQGSHEDIA